MLGMQVKAFSLLLAVLLIVDATAFHGQYRDIALTKLSHVFAAISPSHWHGLGQGRDWSAPPPPKQ